MHQRFTEEELQIAKSVDLTEIATNLGYTVKKVGRYYTLEEMDSIRIYNKTHWFRWSRQYEKGSNGGSQIDFLRVFCGMDVKQAVFWLLDFVGYSKTENVKSDNKQHNNHNQYMNQHIKHNITKNNNEAMESNIKIIESKDFVLPVRAIDNSYLYSYLENERRISRKTIDFFVENDLIYESRHYHNIVFKGKDKDGMTKFASMRGIFDKNGRKFQCDVKGNDKNYGVNVVNANSNMVVVFEAAIDLMSYMDMFDDNETNKLALGMLSDAPLKTFLREHPNVEIIKFCLDNDVPGRKATMELSKKYYELGYEVEEVILPKEYKDVNEWLVSKNVNLEVKNLKCR